MQRLAHLSKSKIRKAIAVPSAITAPSSKCLLSLENHNERVETMLGTPATWKRSTQTMTLTATLMVNIDLANVNSISCNVYY